ncbi:MAG: DUF2608 domain-containing protein [Legionellales bacterium]
MFTRRKKSHIVEGNEISTFLLHISYDSVVLFDLDNTVMESQIELGSDQWFTRLSAHANEVIPDDKSQAFNHVLTVYNSIQPYLRMKPVEPNVVMMIKALINTGLPVYGLTARGRSLQEVTERQLLKIGIDLRDQIIFCDGRDKGLCLKQQLEHLSEYPRHIAFVDDKAKCLQSVKEILLALRIPFTGLRYGFLDEKVKQIDFEKAHVQLAQLKEQLQPSVRASIDALKLTPKKEASQALNSAGFFMQAAAVDVSAVCAHKEAFSEAGNSLH